VQLPKLHEKEIIRLDVDKVVLLLDEVESGEALTEKQKSYHAKTKIRDMALLTLKLVQVSVCQSVWGWILMTLILKMEGFAYIEKVERKLPYTLALRLRMRFLIIWKNGTALFPKRAMKEPSYFPCKTDALLYGVLKTWSKNILDWWPPKKNNSP
jgi:hypothetical protein